MSESALQALVAQASLFAELGEKMSRLAEVIHDEVSPDNVSWADVARFAREADSARAMLELLSDVEELQEAPF